MRLRLDIAYAGGEFSGWARQPGRRTVQAVLEDALARVLRTPVALTVAGRTDAGVHATGQVAHADVPAGIADDSLVRRLAGVLPADVRVRSVGAAPPGFDARFGALWRRYVYRITDAPWGAEPLRRADTLAWSRPLAVPAMVEAAAGLLGEHDYAAFCRRREGATTVRTVEALDVRRTSALVEVEVRADAFCHQMVRSLVGALLAVGDGRAQPAWPGELLALRSRSSAVVVAPPHGLTLVEVAYPADGQLAARADMTRRRRGPA